MSDSCNMGDGQTHISNLLFDSKYLGVLKHSWDFFSSDVVKHADMIVTKGKVFMLTDA